MSTKLIEAAALALAAMETCNSNDGDDPWFDREKVYAARKELKAALGRGGEPGSLIWRLRNLAFSVTLPMTQQARHDMIAAVTEIERLRALLLRQYKADAACYAMPNDCTEAENSAALSEHDAVHALLAREILT